MIRTGALCFSVAAFVACKGEPLDQRLPAAASAALRPATSAEQAIAVKVPVETTRKIKGSGKAQ